MKKTWELFKQIFQKWSDDGVSDYAAALAYYTIFSLAPLLLIAVAIASIVYGQRQVAQDQLINQIGQAVGADAARYVHHLILNASQPSRSITASAIGLVTLLLGAMRVFGQLKQMLNKIWGVQLQDGAVKGFLKRYLLSFLMVLGVGVLLLAMIIASTALAAVTRYLGQQMGQTAILLQIANIVVSLLIFTLLFAMIYRILPDRNIPWSDVWVGAAVTSLLFNAGKALIGLYLAHSSVASPYGAAGSLVLLLVFIYYSALILFFGAEFTEVYARIFGSYARAAAGAARSEPTPAAPPVRPTAPASPPLRAALHGGGLALGVAALVFVRQVFRSGQKPSH